MQRTVVYLVPVLAVVDVGNQTVGSVTVDWEGLALWEGVPVLNDEGRPVDEASAALAVSIAQDSNWPVAS